MIIDDAASCYLAFASPTLRETLATTSKRLSDLESLYKKEKLAAEENNVLLKQAEISLQHLKVGTFSFLI